MRLGLFLTFPLVLFSTTYSQPLVETSKDFIDLISHVRTTNDPAAEAKVKALRLFNEMYEEGDESVKRILTTMSNDLRQTLGRQLIFPSTKENLVHLILSTAREHLHTALATQKNNINKPDEFVAALRTMMQGTFWRFWRNIGIGVGIGASLWLGHHLYKKYTKIDGKAKDIVDTLAAINKDFDTNDPRLLTRICHGIAESLRKDRLSEPNKPPSDEKILALRIKEVIELDKKNGTHRFNETIRLIAHPQAIKAEDEEAVKSSLGTVWANRNNIPRVIGTLWDAAYHKYTSAEGIAFEKSLIRTLSSERLYEALQHEPTRRFLAILIRQNIEKIKTGRQANAS